MIILLIAWEYRLLRTRNVRPINSWSSRPIQQRSALSIPTNLQHIDCFKGALFGIKDLVGDGRKQRINATRPVSKTKSLSVYL